MNDNTSQTKENNPRTTEDYIMDKPVIEYPCSWTYKLVSKTAEDAKAAAEEHVQGAFSLNLSKTSKTAKYISFNLELIVKNEEHRNMLYQNLKQDERIVMVL